MGSVIEEITYEKMIAAGWIDSANPPPNVTPVLVFGYCCDICFQTKIGELEDGEWLESGTGEKLSFKVDFWQRLPYPN